MLAWSITVSCHNVKLIGIQQKVSERYELGFHRNLGHRLFFCPASAVAQPNPVVKVCYTPWGKFGGEDLPGKGIFPDIVSRTLKRAGYRVEVSIVPWKRCIEDTRALRYDLIAAGWEGESFDTDFNYLSNLSIDAIHFITLDGSPLKSAEVGALKGKTVGILRGSGGMEVLKKRAGEFALYEVATETSMLRMLVRGRVEAIISDPLQLNDVAARVSGEQQTMLRPLEPPIKQNFNTVIVAKRNPRAAQLKADFDRAFRQLVSEGLYDDIHKLHGRRLKYRPFDE